MKQRSLVSVALLVIFTLGIYSIVWFVKTKGELNARGAQIPTAWLMIIPLVNLYWFWKYYEGAEQITNGQSNALLNFLLHILVSSIIPQLMLQSEFNKLSGSQAIPSAPPVTGTGPTPANEQPIAPPKESTPPPPKKKVKKLAASKKPTLVQ